MAEHTIAERAQDAADDAAAVVVVDAGVGLAYASPTHLRSEREGHVADGAAAVLSREQLGELVREQPVLLQGAVAGLDAVDERRDAWRGGGDGPRAVEAELAKGDVPTRPVEPASGAWAPRASSSFFVCRWLVWDRRLEHAEVCAVRWT